MVAAGTAPSHVGARRPPRTNDRFRYCQFGRLNERVSVFVLSCTAQQEASTMHSSPFHTESVLVCTFCAGSLILMC